MKGRNDKKDGPRGGAPLRKDTDNVATTVDILLYATVPLGPSKKPANASSSGRGRSQEVLPILVYRPVL